MKRSRAHAAPLLSSVFSVSPASFAAPHPLLLFPALRRSAAELLDPDYQETGKRLAFEIVDYLEQVGFSCKHVGTIWSR